MASSWSRKFKSELDASVFPGAQTFNVGMVLRDQRGTFIAGKCLCLAEVESVFEVEAIRVREALSWIQGQQLRCDNMVVETDSEMTVKAIVGDRVKFLEVGEVIEVCKRKLSSMCGTSVRFVRKNANMRNSA